MTPTQPIEIIQGGATSFIVRITNIQTGDPFPLGSVSAITTCFKKADSTELMLGLTTGITIVDAVLGKLSIALTSAQTALLAVAGLSTLQLTITVGSQDPFIKQIHDAYTVIESEC